MDDDQYPEVEGMTLEVEGCTARISGFRVTWEGGESGKANPGDTINFHGVDGLVENTCVWMIVDVSDGPNNQNDNPVRFVSGSGVSALYNVSGGPDRTSVEFMGPTAMPS